MMKLRYKNLEIVKLQHSTLFFKNTETGSVIAIDPYQIDAGVTKEIGQANAVFLTHDHFDHFSPKDVGLIAKKDTLFVFPASILDKAKTFLSQSDDSLVSVLPLEEYSIKLINESIHFMALPAYNLNKISPQGNPYHPKIKDYVGYLIDYAGVSLYIAGDTDNIPEMEALTGAVDIAFLPVSGTYVMTVEEAVEATKVIQPKMTVPVHYGVVVGEPEMAEGFRQKLQEEFPSVQVEIL